MKDIQKANSDHIDAVYLFEKYHSLGCWKTVRQINTELRKVQAKTEKSKALKENIKIYISGQGWSGFHTQWLKNKVTYDNDCLAAHSKKIVRQGRGKPIQPPLFTAQDQKQLPILEN